MKYQNAYNTEMWNKQNEYNTPAAQMQRLRDAGLNPNIAAGSVGSGNASAPAQSAGATLQPYTQFRTGLEEIGQSVPQAAMFSEQLQNMESDRNLKAKQALSETAKALKYANEADLTADNRRRANELFKYQLEAAQLANEDTVENIFLKKSTIELNGIKADLTRSQQRNVEKNTEVLDYKLKNMLPLEAKEIASRTALNGARVGETIVNSKFIQQKIDIGAYELGYFQENGYEYFLNRDALMRTQIGVGDQNIEKLKIENAIQNKISDWVVQKAYEDFRNSKNSADLKEKQSFWYSPDKVESMVIDAIKTGLLILPFLL